MMRLILGLLISDHLETKPWIRWPSKCMHTILAIHRRNQSRQHSSTVSKVTTA